MSAWRLSVVAAAASAALNGIWRRDSPSACIRGVAVWRRLACQPAAQWRNGVASLGGLAY